MNIYLADKNLAVDDVLTDLQSGVKLAALLQSLSNKSIKYNAKPRFVPVFDMLTV